MFSINEAQQPVFTQQKIERMTKPTHLNFLNKLELFSHHFDDRVRLRQGFERISKSCPFGKQTLVISLVSNIRIMFSHLFSDKLYVRKVIKTT